MLATIEIPEGKRMNTISVNRIVYFEAAGKKCRVHLADRTSILSSRMLKHYHDLLHENGFYRVHRKRLVNLDHIVAYHDKAREIILTTNLIPVINYGPQSEAIN